MKGKKKVKTPCFGIELAFSSRKN